MLKYSGTVSRIVPSSLQYFYSPKYKHLNEASASSFNIICVFPILVRNLTLIGHVGMSAVIISRFRHFWFELTFQFQFYDHFHYIGQKTVTNVLCSRCFMYGSVFFIEVFSSVIFHT